MHVIDVCAQLLPACVLFCWPLALANGRLGYLKTVQKMKSIIDENQLRVMHTIAIYSASYAKIAKPAWWNNKLDLGPVIEQGAPYLLLHDRSGLHQDSNAFLRPQQMRVEPFRRAVAPR